MKDVSRLTTDRLGEILVRKGVISEDMLSKALEVQKTRKKLIGRILVDMEAANEEDIMECLLAQYNVPWLSVSSYGIDKDVFKLFPAPVLMEMDVCPIDQIGDVILLASFGPVPQTVLDTLSMQAPGASFKTVFALLSDIHKVLSQAG